MRPQHVPAGPAVPGRDVTTANRWPRTRALPIEDEEIVGAGFHAELGRPAIADGGKFGLEPVADACHAWREDPRSIALELALRNAGRGALCVERSRSQLRPGAIGSGNGAARSTRVVFAKSRRSGSA